MARVLLFLSLFLFAACASAPVAAPPAKRFKIVGYVSSRADFARIDPAKVTHLNYAFADVGGDDRVVLDDDAPAQLAKLLVLKRANPELKIILSIGGWRALWFSDAALTEESRCRFASSAIEIVQRHQLDGLDIDWEYPAQRGSSNRYRKEDKQNFTLLLAMLRRELDLLPGEHALSIATTGGRYFEHTEMETLHAYVDWINVMTYDFAGGWMPATAHHAQLYSLSGRSTESYVKQHLRAGVPAEKIVVGVPFYGKQWKWVNRKSASGINEPYDLYAGDISWARLRQEYVEAPGFQRGWDAAARAPYLWNPETGTFFSYEDPRSIGEKARFVRELGLGGMMFWEHAHDPDEVLLAAMAGALYIH
jgi:chitinase